MPFIQNVISGGYDVSVSGKHIGHYDEYNKAVSGLNLELKRRNYFPTIWFVTDHGNYWAIDENGNEIKDNLQERISSNLFKSAINVSKEIGQKLIYNGALYRADTDSGIHRSINFHYDISLHFAM